ARSPAPRRFLRTSTRRRRIAQSLRLSADHALPDSSGRHPTRPARVVIPTPPSLPRPEESDRLDLLVFFDTWLWRGQLVCSAGFVLRPHKSVFGRDKRHRHPPNVSRLRSPTQLPARYDRGAPTRGNAQQACATGHKPAASTRLLLPSFLRSTREEGALLAVCRPTFKYPNATRYHTWTGSDRSQKSSVSDSEALTPSIAVFCSLKWMVINRRGTPTDCPRLYRKVAPVLNGAGHDAKPQWVLRKPKIRGI